MVEKGLERESDDVIVGVKVEGLFFANEKKILIEDEVEIVVKYGDLLKVAFPKKHKTEKVIVIAVNRCFDTVISEDLVKADSVHDQLFFLLALTTFDENCVAHCTKYEFLDCIFKLYEYYDAHGQGNELYLYPMGTKMARTGRSCLFLFFLQQ